MWVRIDGRRPRRFIQGKSRSWTFVPLSTRIPNVTFVQMDLMAVSGAIHGNMRLVVLPARPGAFRLAGTEKVDPDGYKTGFANLVQMLEPGGTLYFSVPVSTAR